MEKSRCVKRSAAGYRAGAAAAIVACLMLAPPGSKARAQNMPPAPASVSPTVSPPPIPLDAAATQSAGVQAQPAEQGQPESNQDDIFVFKKEVQEVILHATVVDKERLLVPNLDRSSFAIFEDGVPQTITSFRREDVPVAMGIVIDNSGSMRDKRAKLNQAVLNLIRASNPQDELFVVNFGEDHYLDQDFTSDANLLQLAMERTSMRGSTALYDAIVASATHLKSNDHLDKKVLLVITDGQDNASQESLREATQRLQQENGPAVYAIGLLGDDPRHPGRIPLESFAETTGGVAFFPRTLDEVGGITRTVAHDIRSQYTIGYKPVVPRNNNSYRSIQVEAKSKGYGKLTVRTRSGYYPGEPLR
jgi:Ca-activated chloride channel family protein